MSRELKRSYMKLSRLVHPDKSSHSRSTEAFQMVQAAWQTLSDPEKHAAYRTSQAAKAVNPYRPPPAPAAASAAGEVWQVLRRELNRVSVHDLKGLCRKLGQPLTGRKEHLTQRVVAALAAYGAVQACIAKLRELQEGLLRAQQIELLLLRAAQGEVWARASELRELVRQASACGLTA
eukprot:5334056-Prymnesium_polylepis.1